jgi:NADH-quinone oxidoreductase subunit L
VLSRKFWVDEVYQGLVIRPVMWIADLFRRADHAVVDGVVRAFGWIGLVLSKGLAIFDREGIDAGAVDGLGNAVTGAGEVRRLHTGNVQTYLLLLVAAILVLVVVFAR